MAFPETKSEIADAIHRILFIRDKYMADIIEWEKCKPCPEVQRQIDQIYQRVAVCDENLKYWRNKYGKGYEKIHF